MPTTKENEQGLADRSKKITEKDSGEYEIIKFRLASFNCIDKNLTKRLIKQRNRK